MVRVREYPGRGLYVWHLRFDSADAAAERVCARIRDAVDAIARHVGVKAVRIVIEDVDGGKYIVDVEREG